jgi:hypothetical protein
MKRLVLAVGLFGVCVLGCSDERIEAGGTESAPNAIVPPPTNPCPLACCDNFRVMPRGMCTTIWPDTRCNWSGLCPVMMELSSPACYTDVCPIQPTTPTDPK